MRFIFSLFQMDKPTIKNIIPIINKTISSSSIPYSSMICYYSFFPVSITFSIPRGAMYWVIISSGIVISYSQVKSLFSTERTTLLSSSRFNSIKRSVSVFNAFEETYLNHRFQETLTLHTKTETDVLHAALCKEFSVQFFRLPSLPTDI